MCDFEAEIKSWLQTAFKNDNLKNLNVKILGNSEKGDGYMGDMVFVEAAGTTNEETRKEYNLVLKCSKRSQALRDKFPIHDIFLKKLFIYEKLLPSFLQHQKDGNVKKSFKSYPKWYGSVSGENVEVIFLENLKKSEYELWPKKQPLPRELIDLVITEYGKLHAICVSMEEREPEKFQEFVRVIQGYEKPLHIKSKIKKT